MKKFCLAVLVCLVLAGCSSGNTTPVLKGITFTAEIAYYNESYTLSGQILNDGSMVATLLKPDELANLKLTLNGDRITAEYKGLTYTPVEGSLPFSAVLQNLYDPVCQVNKEGLLPDKNGKIQGEINGTDYTLTLSPTGLPQRLELPKRGMVVTFYNLCVKEDVNE